MYILYYQTWHSRRRKHQKLNLHVLGLSLPRITIEYCTYVVKVMFARSTIASFSAVGLKLHPHERQTGTPNPKPSRIGTRYQPTHASPSWQILFFTTTPILKVIMLSRRLMQVCCRAPRLYLRRVVLTKVQVPVR
jgi:hypothetical protein